MTINLRFSVETIVRFGMLVNLIISEIIFLFKCRFTWSVFSDIIVLITGAFSSALVIAFEKHKFFLAGLVNFNIFKLDFSNPYGCLLHHYLNCCHTRPYLKISTQLKIYLKVSTCKIGPRSGIIF